MDDIKFDSYVAVVINNDTGVTNVTAGWEVGTTDAELYALAAKAIAEMVANGGTAEITSYVHLMAA